MASGYSTQNDEILNHVLKFYNTDNRLQQMLGIINGESRISLRIVDWFSTNYAKKFFTVYPLTKNGQTIRFKVYQDYKLRLKAYSKKRFDPFCRWDRINIPYQGDSYIQTTIGQLNFFKWAIENKVIDYINENYTAIENDMNSRNSSSRRKERKDISLPNNKTRKKREELSVSAVKTIKKENVEIVVKFD